MTTRTETPEGALRSGAILTRSGPIEYQRSEIGLEGDGNITITRTIESLAHPDTLATLRGTPITLGHPPAGESLTPDNWDEWVVGAVAGDPRLTGDVISADVYIGKRNALEELDKGTREISIGYDFYLDKKAMSTKGPLRVNHVALVPKGRAGPTVRVLDGGSDYDLFESSDSGDSDVDKTDVMDAVSAAVDAGMKRMKFDSEAQDAMKRTFMDALGSALDEAIAPLADGMKKMMEGKDAAAEATAEAQRVSDAAAELKVAEAKAITAADDLAVKIRAEERERFNILSDASPLIAEDVRGTLVDSDAKTILVAAVGDIVEDAETRNVDYLRGALDSAIAAGKAGTNSGTGNVLPFGVSTYDSSQGSASDDRVKARDKMIALQTDAYTKAGGI